MVLVDLMEYMGKVVEGDIEMPQGDQPVTSPRSRAGKEGGLDRVHREPDRHHSHDIQYQLLQAKMMSANISGRTIGGSNRKEGTSSITLEEEALMVGGCSQLWFPNLQHTHKTFSWKRKMVSSRHQVCLLRVI